MAEDIIVQEKFDSRRVTVGKDPSAELCFAIMGTDIELDARTALLAVAPLTYNLAAYGGLLAQVSASVEPVGPKLWDGVVRYGVWQATNESTWSFETGGGTQHISNSIATIGRYAAPGRTAPDYKGAIGVTAESVEGVDITVPVFQWSETHYLPDSFVTPAYRGTVRALTGRVNSIDWNGYPAGEVLFMGAAGTKRGYGDWEVTFKFAQQPNMTDLVVGPITGIAKKGWEYLWVRYEDTEDVNAKALIKTPVAVYVEQVYWTGDLNLLGIA